MWGGLLGQALESVCPSWVDVVYWLRRVFVVSLLGISIWSCPVMVAWVRCWLL